MAKRKTKTPEQQPQPEKEEAPVPEMEPEAAPEPEPEPDAVIAKQTCRVTIEGNRDIRLYRGDVFRLPMARILWRDARAFVDRWPQVER